MARIRDTVCGATVEIRRTELVSEHQGATYYFCAPTCLALFEIDPDWYVSVALATLESGVHGTLGSDSRP